MFILKNIILCCIYKIKENKYMHQIMFHLNTTRVDKRETATVLLPLAFWRHATIHHCDSSQKSFFCEIEAAAIMQKG